MKNLIVFSAGVVLGCLLKKSKAQSQSEFMLVDDRESLCENLKSSETVNKVLELLKAKKLDR